MIAFGTQAILTDPERVMAADCIKKLSAYGKSLFDATSFYREYLGRSGYLDNDYRPSRPDNDRVRTTAQSERDFAPTFHVDEETVKKFRDRFGTVPVKLLDGSEIKAWLAQYRLCLTPRGGFLFGCASRRFESRS